MYIVYKYTVCVRKTVIPNISAALFSQNFKLISTYFRFEAIKLPIPVLKETHKTI